MLKNIKDMKYLAKFKFVLLINVIVRNDLLVLNQNQRFDNKPAYFNYDLKNYDDLGVINEQSYFNKYGFRTKCSEFLSDNRDFIYFMHLDWLDNKIIDLYNWGKVPHIENVKILKYFSWSDMVKFYSLNLPFYVFKKYRNLDLKFTKINSIYKLSSFYLIYTSCFFKNLEHSKSNLNQTLFPALVQRILPSPCSREQCDFIDNAVKQTCKNNGVPIYENDFTCRCSQNYKFVILSNFSHKAQCRLSNKICEENLKNCSNNGVCINGTCKCQSNYTGPDCSLAKFEHVLMCSNGIFNGTTCECNPPFSQDTTLKYPNCLKSNIYQKQCNICLNGYCKDENKCTCYHGWRGDNCSIEIHTWLEWSNWSKCRPICSFYSFKKRYRVCSSNITENCNKSKEKSNVDFQSCHLSLTDFNRDCILNTYWSEWTSWSVYGGLCNIGYKIKERFCLYNQSSLIEQNRTLLFVEKCEGTSTFKESIQIPACNKKKIFNSKLIYLCLFYIVLIGVALIAFFEFIKYFVEKKWNQFHE